MSACTPRVCGHAKVGRASMACGCKTRGYRWMCRHLRSDAPEARLGVVILLGVAAAAHHLCARATRSLRGERASEQCVSGTQGVQRGRELDYLPAGRVRLAAWRTRWRPAAPASPVSRHHLWRVNGLVHSGLVGSLAADSKLVVFECHINYRCLVDAHGSSKRRKRRPQWYCEQNEVVL